MVDPAPNSAQPPIDDKALLGEFLEEAVQDTDPEMVDSLMSFLRKLKDEKRKKKGICPGAGCGNRIMPDEACCAVCAKKVVGCVRCWDPNGLGGIERGEFLCPICIAEGHKHCSFCLRPQQPGDSLCAVCRGDAQANAVAGSVVGIPIPGASKAEFAAVEESSRPPLKPAV